MRAKIMQLVQEHLAQKGIHTLRMLCSESGGNAVINSPSIVGLALGTGP